MTDCDLRTNIEKRLANREVEADRLRADVERLAIERAEAVTAFNNERAKAARIARDAGRLAKSVDKIKFITPMQFAADLAEDIADAIERGDFIEQVAKEYK